MKRRRKPGPPKRGGPGLPVQVRCQKPLLARLDKWCKDQPEPTSRPDALRRLAESALTAAGY